jgi:putative membrane protein
MKLLEREREPLERTGQEPDARFTFANERTFLSWARTSLALIGGGLVAAQVLHGRFGGWHLLVALPAIILGAVLGIASYLRWQENERALRLGRPIGHSPLTRMLTAVIVVLAVLSAALIVIAAATR